MEDKKIVRYEELSIALKRKVTFKYLGDKEKSLIKFEQGESTVNAIEIWHNDSDYVVLISAPILMLLEWDSLKDLEEEEEFGSFFNLGYSDEFPDEMGMLFI